MFLAIIAFSYAAFSFLAPWQLNKDDDIVQRNDQIDAAFDSDPVPATEVFGPDGEISPEEEWRRVILQGHYLTDSEVLLRLRPVDSSPAFHALTPFELNSGEILLVNRGFSEPIDGNRPDITDAPTSEVTITGITRTTERTPPTPPLFDAGYQQVYGINTAEISEVTGLDIGRDYVQLLAGEAGEVNAIPIPMLDRGSHLSYGFQWIAFGVMAPLGLGYFIWAELRERRRVRQEEQELSDSTPEPSAPRPQRRANYGDDRPDHYSKISHKRRERF